MAKVPLMGAETGATMLEERKIADPQARDSLASAASEFAQTEIDRIVDVVISELQEQPAVGMFGDVAVRHFWDEYCWALQEGPFDDELGWDDVSLGSPSGAYNETVRACIKCEVEKLPKHALVLLTVRALEEQDAGCFDGDGQGSIWFEGIVSVVQGRVNSKASGRRLGMIGPDRSEVIGYEIKGSGMVWSILSDRGEAMDLIAGYSDEIIAADGDLSKLAQEMVEAFVVAANEEAEECEGVLSAFLSRFEDQVRTLVLEHDVLPSLEDMRGFLQERLDE